MLISELYLVWLAWQKGWLHTRYERRADLFCGLLILAGARTCYHRLTT